MKIPNFDDLPLAQAYIKRMQETPQNPRYHAEGDVWEHTLMVMRKFLEMKGRFGLSPEEEEVMFWASLLHDIGKPEVSRYEDGRWRAPGHEKAGLPIATNILLNRPEISDESRRKILDLVRWHGMPLWWVLKGDSIDKLKEMSTRTDLRLLAIFSYFDLAGRICEDKVNVLHLMERFHQVDVPRAEYEFGRHHDLQERYESWNLKHKNAVWNAFRMGKVDLVEKLKDAPLADSPPVRHKVTLTVGPPLAGKSTWLGDKYPEAFKVNLKDFDLTAENVGDTHFIQRKLVEFKYYLGIYLRRHKEVVVEGRMVDPRIREPLSQAIRNLDTELNYLVFETSLDEILQRNQQQEKPLEENWLRDQYQQLDLLHPWEAHKTTRVKG